MPELILCKICGKRRAKRHCPAVHGEICPICCGNERENTLTCPLDCEYLEQAHHSEEPLEVAPSDLIEPQLEIQEEFLNTHEELLLFCIYALLQAALRTQGAVDSDVTEALAHMVQTYRTRESGLLYDSYSNNAIASAVQRSFSASLDDYTKLKQEREPMSPVRGSDVFTTLVFLHRVGAQNRNGRPRGRVFIDLLRHMTPETPPEESQAPRLII